VKSGQEGLGRTLTIVRLVGAMMLEQNDEWSLNRRYMRLEGLQTVSDAAPTRLPAVAR
jgi:putative transposase